MKIDKATRASLDADVAKLKEKGEAVTAALTAYNEARDTMHGTLDTLCTDLRDEYEGKSERWQEGEKGQAADAWIEEIEGKRDELADEVDIELPDADELVGFGDSPE